MFNNIGKKIMGLAKFICWVGIAISVLVGLGMAAFSTTLTTQFRAELPSFFGIGGTVAGILYAVIGSIISWLSSLVLYGFGQLVDDTASIRQRG